MSYCIWTTAMPCWPAFQLPHWHHLNESCMQWHAPFWIVSHVTVWLRLFMSCTGYRGSSTSCACWFTSRFWDTRLITSRSFWYWLLKHQVELHYMASHGDLIASRNRWQDFLCCCTVGVEQADDKTEAVVINRLISSWTENISLSFCLQAPGHRLILWCALGLLVWGEIQMYGNYG